MNLKKILFFSLLVLFFTLRLFAEEGPFHALSLGSLPKYPEDFTCFDYVNPKAPRGGVLRMEALGSFDSFNPFIIKGLPAAGLGLLFDTLMQSSDDEPFSQYGLLAESVSLAKDGSFMRFNLRPEAKFHDGSPVLASDVVFSFNTLVEKGSPHYARYYRDIKRVVAEDKRRVRFDFKSRDNYELALIIGQLQVLSEKDWKDFDFSRSGFRVPMGSGPYKMESWEPGRRLVYKRNKDYWAKDLPVNKGQYNFDLIVYEYFRDANISLEAFKAGYYDIRLENTAKTWATQYKGPAFEEGRLVKSILTHKLPAGMQGFVMNTRKDIFKDAGVRRALSLVFDFKWSNKALFYNQYKRSESYFSNSEMEAVGEPEKGELFYLEPLRSYLDKAVFGPLPFLPLSDGSGFSRAALLEAMELLESASCTYKNGLLYTAEGRPLRFEILLDNPAFERVLLPYIKNLKKLGIEARLRTVDPSQYINRRQSFDFDMIVAVFPQSLSPGNEQEDFWSCKAAETIGSRNYAGICEPAIDALIERIAKAPDRKALIYACKSLDRVLRHGYYLVPNWHTNVFRLAHSSNIAMPENSPPYGLALYSWWDKNAE